MILFVYWENGGDPKLKEKHQPTLLAWIKNGVSATSKLRIFLVFSLNNTFKVIYYP